MAFIEGVRLTSPTHLATRLEMHLSFIHSFILNPTKMVCTVFTF